MQENPGANASLVITPVKAPKNGYAFVYVSNESDEPVYFDNMQVVHERGRIIEENHYYAFGLKIAAISSKKLGDVNEGSLENKYLYNDKELFDEGELNWYDYGFRNYDPQIGRFTQLDPLTDDYPYMTPYQYASNDPITNIDIDGLEGALATAAAKIGGDILPNITITAVKHASTGVSAASKALRISSIAVQTLNTFNVSESTSAGLEQRNMDLWLLKTGTKLPSHPQEPPRNGGGVGMYGSSGQGGAPHANGKDPHDENIDDLLTMFSVAKKAGPLKKPEVNSFWAWVEMFNKTGKQVAKEMEKAKGRQTNNEKAEDDQNNKKPNMVWIYRHLKYFDTTNKSKYTDRVGDSLMHFESGSGNSNDTGKPDTGTVTIFRYPKKS